MFYKIVFKKILTLKFLFILFIFLPIISKNYIFAENELNIYSNNIVAMDYESGKVLYEKSGYSKVYPASTTKILTAILAIENLDLNKGIVCSKKAIYSTPLGSSIMYLNVGEVLTVNDLLYGLLLQSGNDAANVLAEAVSTNMSDFIILMNKKLKEIGCNNTNFTNAHGFHDKDHYTTPYDMAILIKYAMKNEVFRKLIETKYIEIPPTNKTSSTRAYTNTNKLLNSNSTTMYYEYCLGGKTGYTEEARGTFVGYAKKDDKTIIISVFDGSQNISLLQARFLDSITLFNYSFENFNKEKIIDKNNIVFNIKDEQNSKIYTVKLENDIYTLSKNKIFENYYDIDIDFETIDKNLKEGQIIGSIKLTTINDLTEFTNSYNLKYISSKEYINIYKKIIYFLPTILKILSLILILLILIKIIKLRSLKRKDRNYYNKHIKNHKNINMYTSDKLKIKRISRYK